MADERNFPDVEFVDTDTETIAEEIKEALEGELGRTLYPADPMNQLVMWAASVVAHERSLINIVAKRNLPRYAEGDYLDSLMEIFYGITRQEATPAKTKLRFVLSQAQEQGLVIPAETMVTAGGEVIFQTLEELAIAPGQTEGIVEAECTEDGTAGNGYAAGTVNSLIDQIAYVASVENTVETYGGTDRETDDALYYRARESYEGYTTAGTAGAYKYHAQNHNEAVADVVVQELEPGQTGVTILMDTGIPTEEELEEMQEYLSSDEIRPLTDKVMVSAPNVVEYSVEIAYYGAQRPEPGGTELKELVAKAVSDYITWQSGKLGRRINPGKLTALVIQAGAERVEVIHPAAQEIEKTDCAVLAGEPKLTYGGEDE
jgi:phage-related baseplate assembly protein